MSMQFDAAYYMNARPDVLTAFVNSGAEGGTGLTWPAYAAQHYDNHGWKEGYNPNAIFNTSEYLAANEDVLNAGVNPFVHYLTHGVNEGRAPNASFPKLGDGFDAEAYLAANSDLGEAGIETPEAAYAHFVMHGQFENRKGAPVVDNGANKGETFNLTTGIDNWTGSALNDVANAILESGKSTLNSFDAIDGGGGENTLNIIAKENVEVPLGATVKNFQTVNVLNDSTANTVDVSGFEGAKAIWQSGNAGNISGLKNGQTAGFKGTSGATVEAAAGATEINVALDKVVESSHFTFTSAGTSKVATVSVEGSVAKGTATGTGAPAAGYKTGLTLHLDGSVKTLDLALEGENVNLSVYDTNSTPAGAGAVPDKLVTLNASSSTAGIWLDASGTGPGDANALAALKTASFGSGADYIQLKQTSLKEKAATLDLGAGNDTVKLGLNVETALADATTVAITGGAGGDIFAFTGGNASIDATSATDAAAEALLQANLVSITDFGNGDDVLNLAGSIAKAWFTQNAVNTVVQNFVNNNADATLVQVLSEISNHADLAGGDAFKFDFGGDAYVFIDTATVDTVIQLTGISQTAVTADAVIFA